MDLLPWLPGHPWLWSSCRSLPADLLPSLSYPNLHTPVKSLIRSVIFISCCWSYPSTLLAAFLCSGSHPLMPCFMPSSRTGVTGQFDFIQVKFPELYPALGKAGEGILAHSLQWSVLGTAKSFQKFTCLIIFPLSLCKQRLSEASNQICAAFTRTWLSPVSPAQHQFHHPSLWGEKVLKQFGEVAITHSRAVIPVPPNFIPKEISRLFLPAGNCC